MITPLFESYEDALDALRYYRRKLDAEEKRQITDHTTDQARWLQLYSGYCESRNDVKHFLAGDYDRYFDRYDRGL